MVIYGPTPYGYFAGMQIPLPQALNAAARGLPGIQPNGLLP